MLLNVRWNNLWAQPVLLTLGLVLVLGLGRGLGGERGGLLCLLLFSHSPTLFLPNPGNPGASE